MYYETTFICYVLYFIYYVLCSFIMFLVKEKSADPVGVTRRVGYVGCWYIGSVEGTPVPDIRWGGVAQHPAPLMFGLSRARNNLSEEVFKCFYNDYISFSPEIRW